MSLQVQISIAFSATQVAVSDITGNYDAINNPGGYGAPNPAFNSFAHYLILRKKNVNSVPDVVMALDSYNPLTATTFTATRTIDGWYEAKKLNITIWSAGAYLAGVVREYNGIVYIAASNTSAVPGADGTWTAVSDLTTIEDNASITVTILGRVTAYNANVYRAKQIAQSSQQGKCTICQDDRLKDRMEKIDMFIQAALNADQLGLNSDGEWNVLALIQLGAV